jgi:hypothetical protein
MGLMDDLGKLARQFASDAAASFHALHPTLVKTIGAGALALLNVEASASRR